MELVLAGHWFIQLGPMLSVANKTSFIDRCSCLISIAPMMIFCAQGSQLTPFGPLEWCCSYQTLLAYLSNAAYRFRRFQLKPRRRALRRNDLFVHLRFLTAQPGVFFSVIRLVVSPSVLLCCDVFLSPFPSVLQRITTVQAYFGARKSKGEQLENRPLKLLTKASRIQAANELI